MKRSCKNYLAFLAALCGLIMLSGCGRKGAPVPPGTIRPVAIKDLSYTITPEGAELSWTVPIRNLDGSPIERIKGFEIYKAEASVNETCDGCPPRFGPPIEIPFEAHPEEARKMYYDDRTLHQGMRYIYEVRTVKGWLNISDPSNRISFAWHVPASPPSQISAQPSADGIYLSWVPPGTWADGSPIDKKISYKIYKAEAVEGQWKAIGPPVDSTGFFDTSVKKGVTYKYSISSVLIYHGTEIEGRRSREITAQPIDLTPPKPPEGLVAVYRKALAGSGGEGGVELLWQENSEPDLAGYIVYRRNKNGLIDKLNHSPIPIPKFIDFTRLSPGIYEYWVTAVDRAHPPNESRPSKPASVEIY
ncbi:MAG: hypothetical protein ACP5J5_07410 [Dissulfurimicrobium sp.]|uniref:hypothetical protein n=1 Tax=Dissulfurimicrobium TaxID=1769732 RepID=UPI001EDBED3B|nr:hypothetical protein [Dissulfurimicrobium hydrothermale]UKL13613.1 hypothetical protein LGS26_09125 [Dissulfurimicrobium hydrothermale]